VSGLLHAASSVSGLLRAASLMFKYHLAFRGEALARGKTLVSGLFQYFFIFFFQFSTKFHVLIYHNGIALTKYDDIR
jgi:hypothetical protein